MDGWMVRV